MNKSGIFKRVSLFTAAIVFGLSLFVLVACNGGLNDLSVPQNVRVTDAGYLVWDEVDGADGYVVEFDGKTYETATNRLDVFDLTNSPKTYNARVMACGDLNSFDDSAWSDVCEYKVSFPKKWKFKSLFDGKEYSVACLDGDVEGKLIFPTVGPDDKPVTRIDFSISDARFKNVTSIFFHSGIQSIFFSVAFMNNSAIERISVDKNNIYLKDDGNCVIRRADDALVLGCDGSSIPDYVTSIEKFAFADARTLDHIEIPNTVRTIESNAFIDCISLSSVALSDGLRSIESGAFQGCKSLQKIEVPEGVERISDSVFSGCAALTDVSLPSTLTSLYPGAFIGCTALQEIVIDEQNPVFAVDGNCIMRKADNAVACGFECSVIPDNAEIVGTGAFIARKMTSVVIPEGVRVIESSAFSNCTELEEVVLPTTLKKLGNGAFFGCSKLKRYRLPYGLTDIGDRVFFECELIEHSVVIPDTVATVGNGAFYGGTFYLCGDKTDPDGYGYEDFNLIVKYGWNCDGYSCAGITMKADDGYPYVDTFTYKKSVIESVTINGITQTSISAGNYVPSDFMRVPYRKGYTFAGWATERDGAVKLGVTERTNDKTKEKYYVCLTRADMTQVSTGDTLYAVWTPEK